jgi:hypothetical protein
MSNRSHNPENVPSCEGNVDGAACPISCRPVVFRRAVFVLAFILTLHAVCLGLFVGMFAERNPRSKIDRIMERIVLHAQCSHWEPRE